MNKANGVNKLQNEALVYAITHLEGYKRGESSMQKYYFPIVYSVTTLPPLRCSSSTLLAFSSSILTGG